MLPELRQRTSHPTPWPAGLSSEPQWSPVAHRLLAALAKASGLRPQSCAAATQLVLDHGSSILSSPLRDFFIFALFCA